MEDKKYPIELEVITPLAVGAGNDNDWVKGIDYVQKDGKVYVIDMQKVAAAGVDVEALTALFLKYDEAGICQLLGNRISELSRYVFDSPVWSANNIKSFLRTQLYDKPLVAGSSIKGSVRSALFNYLRTDEKTNEEVFGTMKDGSDFMRFVRIGDIEMPSTLLVNTKLFNLRTEGTEWHGGWKHAMNNTTGRYKPDGFNTLYECVSPGQKGLGNISLAAAAFSLLETYGQGKNPYASKKRALLNEPVSCLFQIVNEVTKTYLTKERTFFEKYPAERSDEVIECIDQLISIIPADGSSCLLKMSAGVGFHSITGDWQFDDYSETGQWTDFRNAGKKKYKSRKIAECSGRLQLMGFVLLRCLTTDETTVAVQQQQQEHQALLDAMITSAKKREAERQRKEEEQRQRELAAQEAERKQREYRNLLEQARLHCDESHWDQAISVLTTASNLCPEATEHGLLMERCLQSKAAEEYKQSEANASAQLFSQPLAAVIKGKTSAGNLVGTTVKWLKVEGHVLGQSEQASFLAEARLLAPKELKNLKSKLSALAKIAGKDVTEKLCEELKIK